MQWPNFCLEHTWRSFPIAWVHNPDSPGNLAGKRRSVARGLVRMLQWEAVLNPGCQMRRQRGLFEGDQESKRNICRTRKPLPLSMRFRLNDSFLVPCQMGRSCVPMCIAPAQQGAIPFWLNASLMSWRDGAGMLASITLAAAMWWSAKMCGDALPQKECLLHFAMTDGAAIGTDMTQSCGQENNPGRMEQWGCLMAPTQVEHSICLPQRNQFFSKHCSCVKVCQIFTATLSFGEEPINWH